MRIVATALAVLMTASASAPAFAAKKKAKAPPAPPPISQNEASWRLIKEGVPGFLPFGIGTLYLAKTSADAKRK